MIHYHDPFVHTKPATMSLHFYCFHCQCILTVCPLCRVRGINARCLILSYSFFWLFWFLFWSLDIVYVVYLHSSCILCILYFYSVRIARLLYFYSIRIARSLYFYSLRIARSLYFYSVRIARSLYLHSSCTVSVLYLQFTCIHCGLRIYSCTVFFVYFSFPTPSLLLVSCVSTPVLLFMCPPSTAVLFV